MVRIGFLVAENFNPMPAMGLVGRRLCRAVICIALQMVMLLYCAPILNVHGFDAFFLGGVLHNNEGVMWCRRFQGNVQKTA